MFTITENPTQILCDHYQSLLQNLNPNEIARMSFLRTLLSCDKLVMLLLSMPTGYMKNSYLLEHIRILETPKLFSFCAALQSVGNHKEICDILLKGKYHLGSNFAYTICKSDTLYG